MIVSQINELSLPVDLIEVQVVLDLRNQKFLFDK